MVNTLPDGNITLDELKLGLLIHFDMDGMFMGDSYVITSITDDTIHVELYHMGEKFPYDYITSIKKSDITKWWTRGETLEQWKNRIIIKNKS